jgi:hypothetical protein
MAFTFSTLEGDEADRVGILVPDVADGRGESDPAGPAAGNWVDPVVLSAGLGQQHVVVGIVG